MTDTLPVLRVIDVIHKFRKAGFVFDRQAKGSHEIWYHPQTHRRVVVQNHPGDIPRKTLRSVPSIRNDSGGIQDRVAFPCDSQSLTNYHIICTTGVATDDERHLRLDRLNSVG